MSYEYIDRSSVALDEFEDEDLRISMLKRQTGKAIDEATAKLLLTQAKLNKALTKLVPGSPECLNILRTLTDLYKNWEELNNLKEEAKPQVTPSRATASKTKPKNSTSNLSELKQKLDEKKREGAGKGTLKILEAQIERLERNEKTK